MTLADLAELFAENPELPKPAGEDDEFAMDSLALTWLLHLLDDRYAITVAPDDPAFGTLTTLRALHTHLTREVADA